MGHTLPVQDESSTRVAVTGVGIVGPHGVGVEPYWQGLLAGRSAIRRLNGALAGLPASAGGIVPDFDPTDWVDRRAARRMARFAQLALAATRLALDDAGLTELDPERTGITIHTGAGGQPEGDREVISRQEDPGRTGPLYVPLLSANMAASNVAIQLGVTGPTTAGVGACAAGTIALAEGLHLVRRGEVDVCLAGATDAALTPYLVASLANAGAMSTADGDPTRISRPFDADRTGFVPAEGAGMLVLESLERARARGARILCELASAAVGSDAFHITSPEPHGAGAERVLRRALQYAALRPDDVDAVIAHGTGTRLNDAAESAALGRVFGPRTPELPVTAPKSVVGHTLGAAGAFSAVAAALAIHHRVLPPTTNYETPDPECPLRIVADGPLAGPLDVVLVNAFGFGGQNAVLVLRAVEPAAPPR